MIKRTDTHFEHLFNCYYSHVFNFINARLRNLADAKDLTQDVFLKVFEKGSDKIEKEKEKAYLFKVARNTINDWIKSKAYRKKGLTTSLDTLVIFLAVGEEKNLTAILIDMLSDACVENKLTNNDLQILKGKIEGYNLEEIALMTGITKDATSKRHQRAIKKLRISSNSLK